MHVSFPFPFKTIFVFLISVVLFFSCGKKEEATDQNSSNPSQAIRQNTGVIIFAVGDVKIGEKKANLGDIITHEDIVLTGKKALCDIQIRESSAGVVIRLKGESEFRISSVDPKSPQDVNLALRVGSGLFKVNNKLSKDEAVNVSTPTMVAGVRGTSFATDVSKKGDATIQVLEGSVATRPRVEEIEGLPSEFIQDSTAVQAVVTSLQATEQVLEVGQKVTVTKAYTETVLKNSGVKETVLEIQTAVDKGDKEAAKKAVAMMDEKVAAPEKTQELQEKVKKQAPPKIEKVKEKDLEKQLKEFEELIAMEKSKIEKKETIKAEVESRNKGKNEALLKRIEQITGKSSETLVLKNGEKISGVIFQEGDTYHVLTPEGKKSFAESEVEGTEF